MPPKIEKVATMVDFCSDRAEAHASFFLALLFGLFGVLAIAQNNQDNTKWMWGIPYWLLFLGSLYTFANFSLYATYAEKIIQKASIYEVKEVKDARDSAQKNPIIKWQQVLKKNLPVPKIYVVAILYAVVAFVSCGMVLGFNQAFGGLIAVFAIVSMAWLYVLYRS